jgi:hypothetical protein
MPRRSQRVTIQRLCGVRERRSTPEAALAKQMERM